jgi:ligand-binding sensor domain-containing protein
MKTALCIVFLTLFHVPASAQFRNKYNYKFKTYTMLDGLVHNFTKKCAEDSNGFLWIITQHGLSRFDGLNFKNFENVFNDTASLPANNLSDIAIDKTNRIWLSYNTGLCYYDQSDYRFHLIKQNNKIVKSSSVVYNKADNCVYSINYDGYTRINCADLSVHVFNFKEPLQVHYYEIGNGFIDSKQRLWIPCPRLGFYVIHIKTNEQAYFQKEIWPISFFEDNNHNTWITTWSEGLLKIAATATNYAYTVYPNAQPDDPLHRTQIQMEAAQCNTLTGDSILWLANETTGIMLFNENTGKIVYNFYYNPDLKNGIATDFNSSIFSDRFGILWICSWHGLTKVNKQEQQFSSQEIPYLQSLHFYNRLSGIEDDPQNKNIAWLSAEGSGILKIDKNTGKVLNRYFFSPGVSKEPDADINIEWRWVKYMFKDHENNIWATTLGGIIKIEGGIPEKIPLTEHNLQVSTLTGLEHPCNSLWFASSDGILNYNPVRNKYSLYKVKADADANYFSDIIVKNDSALLLAGNKGAFQLICHQRLLSN